MRIEELVPEADKLVYDAFSSAQRDHQTTRSDLLDQSRAVGHLIAQAWETNLDYAAQGIRAATFLACLPSLVTVNESRPHSLAVAETITYNFQDLSALLLKKHVFKPAGYYSERYLAARKNIKGELSEVGVLGLLWWAAANGRRVEETYALPATRREDHGRRKEGYNIGTDIVVRRSGIKAQQKIQVKTNGSGEEQAKVRRYHPDIIVLSLDKLLNTGNPRPKELLGLIARGKDRELAKIYLRAELCIEEAEARLEMHRQYKEREQARSQTVYVRRRQAQSRLIKP